MYSKRYTLYLIFFIFLFSLSPQLLAMDFEDDKEFKKLSLSTPSQYLIRRFAFGMGNGFKGWNEVPRRGFRTVRGIALSGSLGGKFPKNYEEGKIFGNNIVSAIKASGTLKYWQKDKSLIFLMHEFF